MILYDYTSIYFEIKSIKDLIKEDKKVEIKNIEKTGRNIYFIISDGKIDLNLFQNKMLKSSKNKKLISNYKTLFENKDFTIINDSINNNKTLSTASSLGGLFNLKDNFEINNAKYSSSYPTLMRFFENTPLAKELEKNNYNFYWSGNIWHDCNIYNKNLCLVNNKKYNKLVYSSRTIWNYLSSSYLGKIFKDYFLDEYFYKLIHKELNLYDHLMIETFPANKKIILKGNNLFFIHDWGPHPPFTYNTDCSFKSYSYNSKIGYKNAYMCSINKLYKFIDYLTINDPNSIIIVTSDTGYFNYDKNLFRMVNFDKCKFNQNKLSQSFVNLFNKTLECALK